MRRVQLRYEPAAVGTYVFIEADPDATRADFENALEAYPNSIDDAVAVFEELKRDAE